MKEIVQYILIVFLCMGFTSCKKAKVDVRGLIDREVIIKANKFRSLQNLKCEEMLIEEITLEVDSTMFFLVQKIKGTSYLMPGRPDRPGRLVDTINLEKKPIE